MAFTTYTYSIASDTLNGAVAPDKLSDEIQAEESITIALQGISIDGDVLDIEFRDAITKSTLDVIVAAHDGNPGLNDAQRLQLVDENLDKIDSVLDGSVRRLAVDLSNTLTGPEGPQGPEGPEGPQGPAGPASIFGTEYTYGESEGESSTTSSSYQQKLRVTTAALPSGNYHVMATAEILNTSDEQTTYARLQLNDSTTIAEHAVDYGEDTPNNYRAFSTHQRLSLSGVNNFDLDYRRNSGGTARIRRARITIWRIN